MEVTFNNLNLEGNIYCLKEDFIPKMTSYQVIGLYKTYKGSLQVTVICRESSFTFRVPKDFTDSSQYKQYYLIKEDCEQKLKEICLQGIITLSKIMGGLDGSSC